MFAPTKVWTSRDAHRLTPITRAYTLTGTSYGGSSPPLLVMLRGGVGRGRGCRTLGWLGNTELHLW